MAAWTHHVDSLAERSGHSGVRSPQAGVSHLREYAEHPGCDRLTTGLDPAMTLGCGGFGGNITSDNISPKHLINVKRVAFEIRPAPQVPMVPAVPEVPRALFSNAVSIVPALPKAPAKSAPESIATENLTNRIDTFLASRGLGTKPLEPLERLAPLEPAKLSSSSARMTSVPPSEQARNCSWVSGLSLPQPHATRVTLRTSSYTRAGLSRKHLSHNRLTIVSAACYPACGQFFIA